VLNSPGSAAYKSEVLYSVLQKGGAERQEYLTALDKDIATAITKLTKLVSVELV